MRKRAAARIIPAPLILIVIIIALVFSLSPRAPRESETGDLAEAPPSASAEPAVTSEPEQVPVVTQPPVTPGTDDDPGRQPDAEGLDDTDAPEDDEEAPGEPELPLFEPYCVEETDPDIMLASTAIMAEGHITDAFEFDERIDFGFGNDYSRIEGVTTFRGNNLRDTAAYGYADIRESRFGERWSISTGSLTAPDGAVWTGHGWTGQPLIVNWPKETREIMNMRDWAREQEELIEVVYPAMDGYVYFAELETGKATRDRLFLGWPFKGSGALDPRGYPLLYVGAGYSSPRGDARIFIVSLVDGSILHTFGYADGFAPRSWNAADGAALVDAENDRLIYPSENGTLYIIPLNSVFDPESGTMTIDPSEPVKWRFTGRRSHVNGKFWLGIESSAAIWRGHVFLSDNGGHLICLDINTLEPVWVQDVLDDTNCTPVIEIEDGRPYIYISTSFHGGWRAPTGSTAPVPIWKIDATTGEVVWRTDYDCYTQSGVSGGVQATAAIGKNALDGLVFLPFARTPTPGTGILAAFDKATGEVVWEFQTMVYSWSSPVCVYDSDGNGYIIYCNAGGNMYLIDGLTGVLLDNIQLGGNVEASPAVYNNTVVVGTRASVIWGVRLT